MVLYFAVTTFLLGGAMILAPSIVGRLIFLAAFLLTLFNWCRLEGMIRPEFLIDANVSTLEERIQYEHENKTLTPQEEQIYKNSLRG